MTTSATTTKQAVCGFCATGNHGRCCGQLENGTPDRIWTCACRQTQLCGMARCTRCGQRGSDAVDAEHARCFDVTACEARQQSARDEWLANNTAMAQTLMTATPKKEKKMTDTTATKTKPKAEPRECLCCEGMTKGGLFLPGHDARYVSALAGLAFDPQDEMTVEAARGRMEKEGCSQALLAKFDKKITALHAAEVKAAEAAAAKADESE